MGSIGPMMGEYLMGAVSDLNIHCLTSVLGLRFPNSKNIFCPPHEQDDFSNVFKSYVGLYTILYALKILRVLQVLRALTPFHQENVIV